MCKQNRGSSGQTTSTLHNWDGGRGKRMGPQKGPMYSTWRGRMPLPFFFSLRFDARPGESRPANHWVYNSNSLGLWIKPIARIAKKTEKDAQAEKW